MIETLRLILLTGYAQDGGEKKIYLRLPVSMVGLEVALCSGTSCFPTRFCSNNIAIASAPTTLFDCFGSFLKLEPLRANPQPITDIARFPKSGMVGYVFLI